MEATANSMGRAVYGKAAPEDVTHETNETIDDIMRKN
jgi:hypothetical protein